MKPDSEWKAYARTGHKHVNGWIEPQVLPIIYALSRTQSNQDINGGVAEIGVHHGRMFIALKLLAGAGENSLAIDVFDDQTLNVDASGEGNQEQFTRNVLRHTGTTQSMKIISADSTTVRSEDILQATEAPVRLFSVDGGHTAEVVAHDMTIAGESIVAGGIIVADDVFNYQWPGVAEGTFRFLDKNSEITPFAIGFNKVFLTTSDYADIYIRTIQGLAKRHAWQTRQSIMHGSRVVTLTVPPMRNRARVAIAGLLRP